MTLDPVPLILPIDRIFLGLLSYIQIGIINP